MLLKRSFAAALMAAAFASSSFAAPTLLGTISLDYAGQSSSEGTFKWTLHGTGVELYTYCFSTADQFSPGETPQVFNVWSIAGATAADVTSSGMLNGNHHSGLTTEHFLEAAAQAVSFGTPGIGAIDTAHNAAIHSTETSGDGAFSGYDNLGVAGFYYLEQANPSNYGYHGQPQGFVGDNPPPGTPEPASLAAVGVGLLGMIRRRRAAK